MMVSPTPDENVFTGQLHHDRAFENSALLVSSPMRADDDSSDISFAAEATDEYIMQYAESNADETDGYTIRANSSSNQPFQVVEIEKTAQGFGFNIVGGIDNPHFPGDIGIYISSVNTKSKSYGIVQQGDKIISFDGIDMSYKTHDEVVSVFRGMKVGHVAKMLIDRNYLTSEDRTQSLSPFGTGSSISYRERESNRSTPLPTIPESKVRIAPHGVSAIVDRLRSKITNEDEDAQSVTSYAPSTHSIIDDVPRTPRKPRSFIDPRNNSWFTEALYLSIGIGALSLTGFLVYRLVRGKR